MHRSTDGKGVASKQLPYKEMHVERTRQTQTGHLHRFRITGSAAVPDHSGLPDFLFAGTELHRLQPQHRLGVENCRLRAVPDDGAGSQLLARTQEQPDCCRRVRFRSDSHRFRPGLHPLPPAGEGPGILPGDGVPSPVPVPHRHRYPVPPARRGRRSHLHTDADSHR